MSMLHVLHFTTSFSESYNVHVDTLFLFLQHPGETMETLKSATQLSTATQASATAGARSDVTGADGGSLNLQHGFAITPGMFDAYVERDAQLGSDASNFAREQFEAQRLVQKKVRECLPLVVIRYLDILYMYKNHGTVSSFLKLPKET